MKANHHILYSIILLFLSCGPTNKKSNNNNLEILPNYSILEISINTKIKCVVYVRINEIISDNQIYLISEKVKNEVKHNSEEFHIFLLQPEEQVGNGAWARVDYDPNFKIEHLGQSVEEENSIIKNSNRIKDYIGLWIMPEIKGDIVIRIRKDTKIGLVKEFITSADPKPSKLAHQLRKTIKNGIVTYKDISSNYGEYYIIEENGDLSAYDKQGYIESYKKLKYNKD